VVISANQLQRRPAPDRRADEPVRLPQPHSALISKAALWDASYAEW